MKKNRDIWLRAAVLGSLWGASEIVLGTFLHNLRIPFSSNLLTAIGIILMIAGHRLWPQRGLIWRAGIICAALKTLSPSHAIFGPMIAISAQAFLMQGAIFLGGRTKAAYLAGGGLAMSWNLVQRILTALMVYGASMVDLYQGLVDYLYQNTGFSFSGYWTPLWVLASLFFAGGVVAAVMGILIAGSAKKAGPFDWEAFPERENPKQTDIGEDRRASPWMPMLILLTLFAALFLLQQLPILSSMAMVAVLLVLAAWYDRSLLRGLLQKPGFWIGLFILASLSGLLLGKDDGQHRISVEGLKTGLHMGLRALIVITGFRALGKEFRNPALTQWFRKRNLGNFLMATRIAFQTTPLLLEHLPRTESWKRPAAALRQLAGSLEPAFHYMKSRQQQAEIILLTGKRGSGKTTAILKLAAELQGNGYSIAGIAAPAVVQEDKRTGFLIRDLSNGEEVPYASRTGESHGDNPIPFFFSKEGQAFGNRILEQESAIESDLFILDEIGPLEMKGEGWAGAFNKILQLRKRPILIVVRPSLIEKFVSRWHLEDPLIFDIEKISGKEISENLREILEKKNIGG